MRLIDITQALHPWGGQTTEYLVHNEDFDSNPAYYGYVDHKGHWIIMKRNLSSGDYTDTYCVGKQNYSTNWTNRASLTYTTLDAAI